LTSHRTEEKKNCNYFTARMAAPPVSFHAVYMHNKAKKAAEKSLLILRDFLRDCWFSFARIQAA
jgi:hypothetical protein